MFPRLVKESIASSPVSETINTHVVQKLNNRS